MNHALKNNYIQKMYILNLLNYQCKQEYIFNILAAVYNIQDNNFVKYVDFNQFKQQVHFKIISFVYNISFLYAKKTHI